MSINNHTRITPNTKIPSHLLIKRIPQSKNKKHTILNKPKFYLNGKSLTKARANNAYVSTPI